MTRLTAVILTYNEEENIADCLASGQELANARPPLSVLVRGGLGGCGRYWDRTSDLFGVNEALSP